MSISACDRIVRATSDEAAAISGYSDTHRRRLEAAGQFPKRLRLNPNGGGRFGASGYRLSDIESGLPSVAVKRGRGELWRTQGESRWGESSGLLRYVR